MRDGGLGHEFGDGVQAANKICGLCDLSVVESVVIAVETVNRHYTATGNFAENLLLM